MNFYEKRPSTTLVVYSSLVSGAIGTTGKFPQLELFDQTGAVLQTVGMADIGNGLYVASFTVPAALGAYAGAITYYDDAGFSIPTPGVNREHFCVEVRDRIAELKQSPYCEFIADGNLAEAWAAMAAHAGHNSLIDQAGSAGHNANNNLIAHRLRLFATRAEAAAATENAGAGVENECYTQTSEATYDDGSASVAPEVLRTFKRQAS